MKVKRYLEQPRKIDRMIENKLYEKEHWKSVAFGTVPQSSGERVQSSGSKQKMADAVSRYVDIEAEIDDFIDDLVDAKKEIIETIEKLPTAEYDLLHMVYIQNRSLSEVAYVYGKTYSWATTIHGRALQHLQKILDEREK